MEGQVLQSHIDRVAGIGRKGVQFEDRNRSWLPRASRAVQDPAPIRSRKAKGKTEKEGSGLGGLQKASGDRNDLIDYSG